MKPSLLSIVVIFVCSSELLAQHDHAAYARHQAREIKALSAEQVEGYLRGEGMGLALPAELNGYPGPRHVLELAEELRLSTAQVEATRRIHESMQAEAMEIGAEIVELERQLDAGFARRTMTAEALDSTTSDIARLQGRLRAVHLRAHLEVAGVLSEAQRQDYDRLRGYTGH